MAKESFISDAVLEACRLAREGDAFWEHIALDQARRIKMQRRAREDAIYRVSLGLGLGGIAPTGASARWGVAMGDAFDVLNQLHGEWWNGENGGYTLRAFWAEMHKLGWSYDEQTGFITEEAGA